MYGTNGPSYAVAAIENGDDIKTVQNDLGHATAAFTLNIYAHTTQKMRQESATGWSGLFRVFQAVRSEKGENKGEKQNKPP